MAAMVGPGERIGRYRLRRRLGAGAFATVWLGDDEDLEVPVAVKVLADNWATHADVRDRFVSVAKLMRRIADDRVIKVYDIGTLEDERPYFVMDFANGGTLADRLAEGVNPHEALLLGAEAARAVQVLHDNGVLHRDVTPANLLIRREPDGGQHVVITDLGMAKAIAEATGLTLAAGTPAYMAPEQAGGLGGFDARADVYSVAAVVYTLLAGAPPFGGRNLVSVISRSADLRPEPLAARFDGPAELDDVLAGALAYEPDDRPPTAVALAGELERLADGWGRLPLVRPAAAVPGLAPVHDEPDVSVPAPTLRLPAGTAPTETDLPAGAPSRSSHRLGAGFWLFTVLVFVLTVLATWAWRSGGWLTLLR
jgi:serine/threonine protein kinase